MICEYCGAPMDEGTVFCTQCGAVHSSANAPVSVSAPVPPPKPEPAPVPEPAPPKQKKALHPALRVLLSLCTVLLCIVLSVSLVATTLVMDLQRLTSEDGLAALTEELLYDSPRDLPPALAAASLGGLEVAIPNAPDDPEGLADMILDAITEEYAAELKLDPAQLQTFVEESTAKEFVSGKLASYAEDLITGERSTTIETDEILDLIDENLDLVEDTFGVTVDRTFRGQVREFLNQNDINGMIQTNILDPIANAEIPGLTLPGFSGTATVADLLAQLQAIASAQTLTALMLLNVILLILLVLTNRLRVGPALVSAGVPALIVGVLLSLPVALIQLLPVLLGDSLGLATIVVSLIGALVGRIAPVHYGVAIVGLVLIIAGAIVKSVTKKQPRQR